MQPSPPHPLHLPRPTPMRAVVTSARNPTVVLQRDVSSRFGLRLRQLRLEHKLTQVNMAVAFGIDRTFISDVERGRKSISLPMLEVMALGFELSLSELLRDV